MAKNNDVDDIIPNDETQDDTPLEIAPDKRWVKTERYAYFQ